MANSYFDSTLTGQQVESILKSVVNPNLLDNWYFGKPVNQRGVSGTISTAGYFLDRWKLTSGSVTINSDSISLNGTIVQILENAVGQTVKATALTTNGITDVVPTYNDSTHTLTITASNKTIKAVKLELGSVQTLAHEESSVWVLNEIPDYGEQLRRCQRYLTQIDGTMRLSGCIGGTASTVQFFVPAPVTMRTAPTLLSSFGLSFRVETGAANTTGFSVDSVLNTVNGFLVIGTAAWSGSYSPAVYRGGTVIPTAKSFASADL